MRSVLNSSVPVVIRFPGVEPVTLHVHREGDRFVSRALLEQGAWEPFQTGLALSLVRPGDTFLDVGAHLGWYTVLAARRVGGAGRVVAFEPDPENLALLRRNVHANGLDACVRVEPLALTDSRGAGRLYLSPDQRGDQRLFPDAEPRGSVPIATESLDGYMIVRPVALPGPVRLIKLDAQGAEAHILRGLAGLWQGRWRASRPALLLEFWPYGLLHAAGGGDGAAQFVALLEAMELELRIVDEAARRLNPITPAELLDLARHGLHPDTQRFANLLAMPRGWE